MVLDHAYIWSCVRIASNVEIIQSVVCDRAEVKEGVTLKKQCVLAYDVSSLSVFICDRKIQVMFVCVSLMLHL